MWAVAWGLFGLPWDGSADDLNSRGVLWTLLPETYRQLVDAVLNFAFYVPLGILLRSLRLSVMRALALGAMLSATTEVLQLSSATRVPNLADLVLNTAGVVVGFALWGWSNSYNRGGPCGCDDGALQ